MAKKRNLPEVKLRVEELDKCVNCGLCQAVCPTFLVKGNEGLTARGKIALLKDLLDGSLQPSATIADLFDDCLTCYACQTVCPAGVKTQHLWTASRQNLAALSRTGKIKYLGLNWTIGKPKLFEFEVNLTGWLAGFNRDNHQQASFKGMRFPIFRGAPYLQRLKEEYPPLGEEIGTIGLLLGCSSNLATPWIADATIDLLTAAGWRVIIPREQVCCGAPAINNANWDVARRLARLNLKVFNSLGVDRISSPDGTCVAAFKHDYFEIFRKEPEILPDVERLSSVTIDLSAIIAEAVELKRIRFKQLKSIVTLHNSCHITHLGSGNRWQEILDGIDGLELRVLPESDHCCGFGGSYVFFHHDTSKRIAERKVERVLETGADEVLVGSPGCLIQLQSIFNQRKDRQIIVRHVVELLRDALKLENRVLNGNRGV